MIRFTWAKLKCLNSKKCSKKFPNIIKRFLTGRKSVINLSGIIWRVRTLFEIYLRIWESPTGLSRPARTVSGGLSPRACRTGQRTPQDPCICCPLSLHTAGAKTVNKSGFTFVNCYNVSLNFMRLLVLIIYLLILIISNIYLFLAVYRPLNQVNQSLKIITFGLWFLLYV